MGGNSSNNPNNKKSQILIPLDNKFESDHDPSSEFVVIGTVKDMKKKEEENENLKKKNSELERQNEDKRKESLKLKKESLELKKENAELKIKVKEEDEKKKEIPFIEDEEEKYNNPEKEERLLKKKEVLQSTLTILSEDLRKIDDINEIQKFSTKGDDKESLNLDKSKYCCCCNSDTFLNFNFKYIGFFFVMFFFIGLYQLLWIINSTTEEMIFGFKSFFLETNRTIYYPEGFNYTQNYENNIFKDLPNFNLFYIWSIAGNAILKCMDYHGALILYMVINAGFIYLFRLFIFPESYSPSQFGLIFLFYSMLSFSIGSITLFAQQIYFNGLNKYYFKKKEIKTKKNLNNNNIIINDIGDNEENNDGKENKVYFFVYLWTTEIPAYLINLLINYYLRRVNYFSEYYLDFFTTSIILFSICSLISIFIYLYYSRVFYKNKNFQNKIKIQYKRICGYIIYSEEKVQGLKVGSRLDINKSNFDNNDNDNDNNNNICCYACKLAARKFLKNSKGTLLGKFCCNDGCFGKLLFRCCCCYDEYEELTEFNQGKELICILYKVQRELSWFCDLLFKNNVLDLIIYNIINELLVIGFQKEVKIGLRNSEFDLISNIIKLSVFIGFFTFFAFLNEIIVEFCNCAIFSQLSKKGKDDPNSEDYIKQRKFMEILTISNSFFTSIFSGFLMFGNDIIKEITLKYLITLPIALTQFYIFILTKCLLNIMDSGNIDLLSNSIVVSLFLGIFHLSTFVITDIVNIAQDIIIIFQFSIGILFILVEIISSFCSLDGDCCNNLCNKCKDCDECCECKGSCDCCDNCCNDSTINTCHCFDCDCCDCDCCDCDRNCCCKSYCPYNCCNCCCSECYDCCCYCCKCC